MLNTASKRDAGEITHSSEMTEPPQVSGHELNVRLNEVKQNINSV